MIKQQIVTNDYDCGELLEVLQQPGGLIYDEDTKLRSAHEPFRSPGQGKTEESRGNPSHPESASDAGSEPRSSEPDPMEVWSPGHDEMAARMDLNRLKARIGRGEVINESDLQWETYIKAKADGDLTNIVKYNFVMATVKNDAVSAKDRANKGVDSTVPEPRQQPAELLERSRGREDNGKW